MTSRLISSFTSLSDSSRKSRMTQDTLKQLMKKLDGKADHLKKQIKAETNQVKLSRLKRELQVLNAQRDKGGNILNQA